MATSAAACPCGHVILLEEHSRCGGQPEDVPAAFADLRDIGGGIHFREQDECGWILGVEIEAKSGE